MGFISVLGYAHKLIQDTVKPGESVIDATVGNGADTLFLALSAGSEGTVYGFDIQREALERAAARVESAAQPCAKPVWIHDSHAKMSSRIPPREHGKIAAVMFNLGYLPGAAHDTVTLPDSTVEALDASLRLLREGGVVTIVLYTGHPGGPEEAAAVEAWAARLPQDEYQAVRYDYVNQVNRPPYLLALLKRHSQVPRSR